jgi:hypothetical protein
MYYYYYYVSTSLLASEVPTPRPAFLTFPPSAILTFLALPTYLWLLSPPRFALEKSLEEENISKKKRYCYITDYLPYQLRRLATFNTPPLAALPTFRLWFRLYFRYALKRWTHTLVLKEVSTRYLQVTWAA